MNSLPRSTAADIMARQLMRAGTSVGANVEEAQGSHSRKDFIRRLNIARMEARESLYWLRLIESCRIVPEGQLTGLVDEADQIVRILVASVKRSRSQKDT